MRGTVAKALRRRAYGDQSLRQRDYTVERHRNIRQTWTLHAADAGRVNMNTLKRERADRSMPDPKGARRVDLAVRRTVRRQKQRAREAARRAEGWAA